MKKAVLISAVLILVFSGEFAVVGSSNFAGRVQELIGKDIVSLEEARCLICERGSARKCWKYMVENPRLRRVFVVGASGTGPAWRYSLLVPVSLFDLGKVKCERWDYVPENYTAQFVFREAVLRVRVEVVEERDRKIWRSGRKGIEEWCSVLGIKLVEVGKGERANLVVKFADSSQLPSPSKPVPWGFTYYEYDPKNGEVVKEEITVFRRFVRGEKVVEPPPEAYVRLFAHEFGHFLGITFHSSRKGDVMYWLVCGSQGVTSRDLATYWRLRWMWERTHGSLADEVIEDFTEDSIYNVP